MLSSQIMKYDPLVSDAACHTRAPYLIYLSRKSKTAKLSSEEESYLEACEILTETQARKLDVFGVIIDEKTDITKISSKYIPANSSNTKKNTFLAQKKSEVAKSTLTFLQDACKDLTLNANPEAFTFHIPSSKHYIPVLPLYVSAKMMLHYAAKQTIPLVVNIKRLALQGTKYVLDGASSLAYNFDSGSSHFILQELNNDPDVIAIDMVSCYVKDKEAEANNFLTSSTFKAFLEAFSKEDVTALIMICAAGHPQYPSTAEPPKLKKEEPNTGIRTHKEEAAASSSSSGTCSEDKVDLATPTKINLNECTEKEYKQLAALARHYGFFRENAQYARIDTKSQKLIRATTCLPFYIDHIYASSMKECQAKTGLLVEKQASLSVDQEETLAIFKTLGS